MQSWAMQRLLPSEIGEAEGESTDLGLVPLGDLPCHCESTGSPPRGLWAGTGPDSYQARTLTSWPRLRDMGR